MKQQNQQGFTLLEMLGALIIIGMMLYALTDVWQQGSRMAEQAQAAWHIKTVNERHGTLHQAELRDAAFLFLGLFRTSNYH